MQIKRSSLTGNSVYDYEEFVAGTVKSDKKVDYLLYPGVTPMWDNSARRKTNAFVLHNSTPEKFGNWLKEVIRKFNPPSEEENFIFINAWNEWAEGNHLEPCQKWGRKYLEVVKDAFLMNEK